MLSHAQASDIIIDLDAIAKRVSPTYSPWVSTLTSELLSQALRARNAMIGALAHTLRGQAWLIVGAPTQAERDWWSAKLGGQVVLLDPGERQCKLRAMERGTPRAIKGIEDWYRAQRMPWIRKRESSWFSGEPDEDGWPVDPRHPANAPR